MHVLLVDPATGDLWAGGYFNVAGGSYIISSIARWDGIRWTGIGGVSLDMFGDGTLTPGIVTALALENGSLYVGGTFTEAGTEAISGVARFDLAARTWHGFGDGLALSTRDYANIRALVVRGAEVIVGGHIHRSGGRYGFNNVARWDGQAWEPLGSGVTNLPDPDGGLLPYVDALALVGDDLWIGGGFELAGEKPSLGVARYALPAAGAGTAIEGGEKLIDGSDCHSPTRRATS